MDSSLVDRISFGPFEFDSRTGRLLKHGRRIKLQPKCQTVLRCLLERQGELVTRQELHDKLWPKGTYVDFDLGLYVAIKKLRDALNDSIANQAYVQTVQGEGYRFVAAVRTVPLVEEPAKDAECRVALPLAPGPTSHASIHSAPPAEPAPPNVIVLPLTRPRRRLTAVIGAAAAVVVLSVVVLILLAARSTPLHLEKRDWVLVAAFENRTGEKLFDGTLESALEYELSESSYINVVPHGRVADALVLMRQSPDILLGEEKARQVAVRDGGIKAVLAGRIEKFDQLYVLSMRLIEPASGSIVASFTRQLKQSQVPGAVKSIAESLRTKIGELPYGGGETKVEKATTPSLPALKNYSAGMKLVYASEWAAAAILFEEAIREDSDFGAAHIYAAHCYSNLGEKDKARPHYQAAFRLSPHLSERERLFILGSYYERFVQDYRRAVGPYEALLSVYPDDYWASGNLANVYGALGETEKQIPMQERCIMLRPHSAQFLGRLVGLWELCNSGAHPDPVRAKRYGEQLLQLHETGVDRQWKFVPPPGFNGEAPFWTAIQFQDASGAWRRGNLAAAAAALAHLATRSDADPAMLALAHLTLGRTRAAAAACSRIGNADAASSCLLRVALARSDAGMARVQLARLYPRLPDLPMDAVLAARLGELGAAERSLSSRHASIDLQPSERLSIYYQASPAFWDERAAAAETRLLLAEVLLARGRPADAVKALRAVSWPVSDYGTLCGYSLTSKYTLARALERQGKVSEAIAELEHIPAASDLVDVTEWQWPQCRAKLAGLYRRAGRTEAAASVESELARYLAQADCDHPILRQLRNGAGLPANR